MTHDPQEPNTNGTKHEVAPAAEGSEAFAIRLRQAREERGFTQGAVSNRTKMIDPEQRGVSRTALIGYEQGTSNPGLREIRLLCEVLRVTPNWLIYGSESAIPVATASAELLNTPQMEMAVRTALALCALKGHERDALQSIVLSLAGRQLGDLRLSGLLTLSQLAMKPFHELLKDYVDEYTPSMALTDIAEAMSVQQRNNTGHKLKFDDEGNPVEGSWVYPDPKGVEKW